MAYVQKEQTVTSVEDAFSKIITEMSAAGWTLHDNISTEEKVYSSNGETGTEIVGYIRVRISGSNIYFHASLYWDIGTHTGSCLSYTSGNHIIIDSGEVLCTMGSKDLFFAKCGVYISYYDIIFFGHIPSSYYEKVYTTLTANATAGDGAILTVGDTTNFLIESEYQIVGLSEGRDMFTVSSVTDATHMVVHNLPHSYATGANIGIIPSLFGLSGRTSLDFFPVCHINNSGNTTGGSLDKWALFYYVNPSYLDPSRRTDRYILQPISVLEASGESLIGYSATNIFYTPSGTQDDLFGVKEGHPVDGDVGTSGVNTLTDSNKSWAVNEHVGRDVVITSGLGLGQVRSVVSNTSTVLTISGTWTTNPDATSTYAVVDDVYVKQDPWPFVFKVMAPLH